MYNLSGGNINMADSLANKLTLLGTGGACGDGTCPAVYKDDTGRIFIQGSKVESNLRNQVNIPDHEDIVELSPALLSILNAQQ